MHLSGIRHEMDHRFCFALSRSKSCGTFSANPQDGFARFVIRIQTAANDIASVTLHTEDKYLHYYCADRLRMPEDQRPQAPEGFPFYGRWSTAQTFPMRKYSSDGVHDFFEAQIDINTICLRYYFELRDTNGAVKYYGDYQFTDTAPENPERMFDCPQTLREDMLFDTPDWAKNRVIYQIFPTAFAIGDTAPTNVSAPADTTGTVSAPTDTTGTVSAPTDLHAEAATARERLAASAARNPEWYRTPATGTMNLHGNLRGIIEALPHIQELGAGMIYLNPIFNSPVTPHKYDTYDYMHIEPSIGTEDDLRELVREAHKRDIRVILDGVFNHTSRDFFAFKDVLAHGRDSKYWDWYWLNDWPLTDISTPTQPNYKTFAYFAYMPKLNMSNPEVQDYFINVCCHWVKVAGIDGWRMDVADEIDHVFWKRLRAALHAINPETIIGAEVWHPAFDFLEGDEWDTVMNYHFLKAVKRFVATGELTASGFVDQIGFMRGMLHPNAWPIMWNLLDSHDTMRFQRVCGDDLDKYRLAVGIQMLSTGMPIVYYGDEYGLTGDNDPDCRRGMPWSREHQVPGMHDWFSRLIALRKSEPAIVDGEVLSTTADDSRGLVMISKSLIAKEADASHVTPVERTDMDAYAAERERIANGPRVTIVYHNSPETHELQGFDGQLDLVSGERFNGTLKPYQVLALSSE